jgi:hypothetical protein
LICFYFARVFLCALKIFEMKTRAFVDQIAALNTIPGTLREALKTVVGVLLSRHGQHAHRGYHWPQGIEVLGASGRSESTFGREPGAARIAKRSGSTPLVGVFTRLKGRPDRGR